MESRVLQEGFWKERFEKAQSKGALELYRSVYETSESDWSYINESHRAILSRLNVNSGRVLDAACGYGRNSWLFDDYVGVDLSDTFIEKAKHTYPNKKFIRVDITQGLPFDDGYFDWAVCVSLKDMLVREVSGDYWLLVLKELKRVAKKVLILEYSNPKQYEII